MKKIVMFLLCSCLFVSGISAFAATQRKKQEPAPATVITRSVEDPSVLTLQGQRYMLLRSELQTIDDHEGWLNVYTLEGEESDEHIITIMKFEGMQNSSLFDDEKMDDYITLDRRDPKNILVSKIEDGYYVVGRMVQVDQDTFGLLVSVSQDEIQSPQDKKELFHIVRNTPLETITGHFVESSCKFGSDCRLD